jgi:hypothetical protein
VSIHPSLLTSIIPPKSNLREVVFLKNRKIEGRNTMASKCSWCGEIGNPNLLLNKILEGRKFHGPTIQVKKVMSLICHFLEGRNIVSSNCKRGK